MFYFHNDYNETCHPAVMAKLVAASEKQYVGYGLDESCERAISLIRKECKREDVAVHFLVGGTQTNLIVIAASLRPHQGVLSADAGHINVHETGAIESTGHKLLTVPNYNGKVSIDDIKKCIKTHVDEHMVLPKIVYISESTETGSVYCAEELKELYNFCHENNLYLFVDGARLGVAFATNLISLDDLAKYSDVFYIGGAKNGALLGEALVVVNDSLKENIRFSIKQNGGMYSKGFVAGIQFEELFKDNLFLTLGKNANECTKYLHDQLVIRGIMMQQECVTNQIFPIVNNDTYDKLKRIVLFELWEDLGDKKVIRLVCDFKTKKEEIDLFMEELDLILN